MRKKTFELSKFERMNSELESQLEESKYELKRVRELANKKEEEVLNLHEKQYQMNKQSQLNSRTELEIKNLTERVASLES